jgi:predicted RND superfamily exporter protein
MISIVDLRKRGLKAIEEEIKENKKAIISYKGKAKYVMIPIEEFIDIELERAYQELKEKKENNQAFVSSADELIKRIENEL